MPDVKTTRKYNINSEAFVTLQGSDIWGNYANWGYTDTPEQAKVVHDALHAAVEKPQGKGSTYIVELDDYSAVAVIEFLEDVQAVRVSDSAQENKRSAHRLRRAADRMRKTGGFRK